jgi:hypothetical protein
MGTKISSEISKEEEVERKQQRRKLLMNGTLPNGLNELQYPLSSYEGLQSGPSNSISKNGSFISPNNSMLTSSSISVENEDYSKSKIPTKIVWREGGNVVYVTGDFANWKQWFVMNKSIDNPKEFTITIDLPKGIYQYKFIVDKVWKFSKDLPQIKDERGNINNTLEVKDFIPPISQTKKIKVNYLFISIYK